MPQGYAQTYRGGTPGAGGWLVPHGSIFGSPVPRPHDPHPTPPTRSPTHPPGRHVPLAHHHLQFNCSALSGLQGCAEPQCTAFFDLRRFPNGTISCVRLTPTPAAAGGGTTQIVIPYDYDLIFQFGNSVVLDGTSLGVQASSRTTTYT